MNARTFELYLLSRMRSRLVESALRSLGASRTDADDARAEAIKKGLENTVRGADLYREILGSPVETHATDLPPDSPFHGSQALRFRFTTWATVDFVVNEHPTGYAWGEHFTRRASGRARALEIVADLRPWDVVAPEVKARFGALAGDAWTGWEDVVIEIPPAVGDAGVAHLLRFDFDLLQSVERLR